MKLKLILGILAFPYVHTLLPREDRFFENRTENQIGEIKVVAYLGFFIHLVIFAVLSVSAYFYLLTKVLPCSM